MDGAPFLLAGGFFGYFYAKISTVFLSSALKIFSYIGTAFFLILIIYYLIYPNYFAALESSTVTLTFIVILDAGSLRREVGKHAVAINRVQRLDYNSPLYLRERMGHSRIEILAGVVVGSLVGYFVYYFA
jgi:hypothetical protein